MSTNNSMATKKSIAEMENCIQTSNFVMEEESDSDQSTASWSDESLYDSDYSYGSADFDDTKMFDEVVAVVDSITKNTAPRVRMPGTHGSGGDLHLMGSQQAALQSFLVRRNSYDEKQMGAGIKMAIQTTMKPTETKQDKFGDHPMADPKLLLKSILESHGASSEPRPYASLEGFFVTMTEDMVASYDMETVSAIRKGSLDDVRKLHEAGKNLVACNPFGESIIHLACRHGKTDIVEFLMFQAGTSPRVVCDSGRTPMHDACWTAAPNFECIRLVLQEVPDLLLIADKRGHTPLAYLPRDTWGEWSAFLNESRDILVPKYLG
jgi:hypothetical protein